MTVFGIGWRYELNCLPKRHVGILTLVPVNVIIFGNKAFADGIVVR